MAILLTFQKQVAEMVTRKQFLFGYSKYIKQNKLHLSSEKANKKVPIFLSFKILWSSQCFMFEQIE